jgi:hypothetical protein
LSFPPVHGWIVIASFGRVEDVGPKGIRLCRPSEAVLELLENPDFGAFTKEDGEVVQSAKA